MRHPHLRVWLIVLALALGPAVGNGIARFGYGLILPAMRADLGWSYATAGWINTANAAGYLVGALLALRFAGRIGPGRMFRYGMALTTVCLVLSGFTENIFLLVLWRLLAGIGGAPVFIMGGAMAATTFPSNPARNAFAIAVYFGGGGLGILLTAVSLPLLLEQWGPTAWPYAWWALGAAGVVALPTSWWATKDYLRHPQRDSESAATLRWGNILPSLVGYFLFGAGYIVYMTFVVAWMRDGGATVSTVIATWATLGLAVMLSSYPWRRLIAAYRGGIPLGLSCLATGVGAVLPLVYGGWDGLILSAAIFGLSFFIVPSAITSFTRRNMPQELWGAAVALYTAIFATGQMVGPIAAGWIADITGDLTGGLMLGAALLGLSGIVALLQSPLTPDQVADVAAGNR